MRRDDDRGRERPAPSYPDPADRALGARADAVREALKGDPGDDRRPGGRPFFVEFAGTPKSGKSTTIDATRHFLHRHGIKVYAPSEGASRRTPRSLKDDLTASNTWSACYALQQLLEARHSAELYEVGVLDRGLFDSLVWFELLAQQGRVDPDARDTVQRFLLLEHWRDDLDLVLMFIADPQTAMDRENANVLVQKAGRAMNGQFLAELNDAYGAVADKYSHEFPVFVRLDTSTGSSPGGPRASARTAVDVVLGTMEASLGIAQAGR